jgi:hypothetical protein
MRIKAGCHAPIPVLWKDFRVRWKGRLLGLVECPGFPVLILTPCLKHSHLTFFASADIVAVKPRKCGMKSCAGKEFPMENSKKEKRTLTACDLCANYEYSEETGFYECLVNLDEDEMAHFLGGSFHHCPYFSLEGEYRTVRKQN